jgi:hypothetical protein
MHNLLKWQLSQVILGFAPRGGYRSDVIAGGVAKCKNLAFAGNLVKLGKFFAASVN